MKYRIIADENGTGRRLSLRSVAGREWFSVVGPNLTENHYHLKETLEKIERLKHEDKILVILTAHGETDPHANWRDPSDFGFFGEPVIT